MPSSSKNTMVRKAIFILISSIPFLFGQAQITVSGVVVNQYAKPFEGVSILLKSDSLAKHSMTDSLGRFRFEQLSAGNYLVEFTFSNSQLKQLPLVLHADTSVTIVAEMPNQNLSEIYIREKKPLVQHTIDRTIFLVQNSSIAAGSDGFEVLKQTPGVRVQNGDISLLGKSSVNVMLDDRLLRLSGADLVNLLKSIPGDNIARIEIITNPPARYDAQGNSGLINIVLKKSKTRGYNGSARVGYVQRTHPFVLAGTTFNYNSGKLKLYASASVGTGSAVSINNAFIHYPRQDWNTYNRGRFYDRYFNGQLDLDYDLNPKSRIGLSLQRGNGKPDKNERILTNVSRKSGLLDSVINTEAAADIRTHFQSTSLYYKHSFDSAGKMFSVDVNWFNHDNENARTLTTGNHLPNGALTPGGLSQLLTASDQAINLYTLKADMEIPYGDYKFSFGGKSTFIDNNSDIRLFNRVSNTYLLDGQRSDRFKYREHTNALYASAEASFGKWKLEGGLRGEHTTTVGLSESLLQKNRNSYSRLFPTLYALYELNENHSISIDYGRRIDRPNFQDLNPFRWYDNPYSWYEGNPFLQPSYNHNVELSHSYKDLLTTTLSYSHGIDVFDQITLVEPANDTQRTLPLNFITDYSYKYSNSLTFSPFTWLQSNNDLEVYYTKVRTAVAAAQPVIKGWGAYVSTTNQLTLNKKKTWMADVNAWYQFPEVSGIDRTSAYYNVDLGLKALLMKKNLQVTLSVSDIFGSNRSRLTSYVNDIKEVYVNYADNRRARITFRYRFGNNKISHSDREQASSEEQSRIKSSK